MNIIEENSSQARGRVHVYTGEGKGKTTAAIGLAVRAAGAGQDVLFVQFLKGRPTSELAILERLSDRITVRRFGGSAFVRNGGTEFDARQAARGLELAASTLAAGTYDLVVLDEINLALATGLLEMDDVLGLLALAQPATTLLFTGRYACQALIDRADLVTEMREVKHYYRQGVAAAVGIEM